ncbi:MAG: hypothetical protein LBP87_04385 [Planctomycetaceae bacterium]|nr:hypothetical protein [Planctomycetaceae bacterium]
MTVNVFMMNKFMFIVFVLLSFLLVGCDNDNNEEDETFTTVEEDKVNIQASFDRTKNLIENLKNGSFYKFADQFLEYQERYVEKEDYYWAGYWDYVYNENTGEYEYVLQYYGDYSYNENTGEYEYTPGVGKYNRNSYGYYDDVISEFVELMGEKLEDVVDFDKIGDEKRFNFSAFAGKYVWNNSNTRWDKTSNNAIIAQFPSSENKGSNDCEAAITSYEDKLCNIEGNNVYLPTKANIYFKKDGEKLFSADVSADFSEYGIPKQVAANVYVKPLAFNVALTQESPSKFKANVSIADETKAENNLIIRCEATLSNGLTQHSDFDDMEVNVLKFTLVQHELSIVGTVDLKTLSDLSSTAKNINECTNFEVLYKTQKIGTLTVVDLDDNQYLYIVYKDGTKENTSIYYDSFIEDIKTIFEKYLE